MVTICKIGVDAPGPPEFAGRGHSVGIPGGRHRIWIAIVMVAFLEACSAPGPRWRMNPSPIHGSFYRVRPGDTLYSIARRSGRDYRSVARWNHIRPPYTIYVDQVLRLSPPKRKSFSRKGYKMPRVRPQFPAEGEKKLKIHWRWPLQGVIVRDFAQTGRKGIDIAAVSGTPVRAAASGRIVYSGNGLVGYGNLVIIKHGKTYLSAYGNNRRLIVREGQKVDAGQIIAELGQDTDRNPVLHFEIRVQGDPVDPLRYLPGR